MPHTHSHVLERLRRSRGISLCLTGAIALATGVTLSTPAHAAAPLAEVAHQVLAAGDGWASADGGTTGGSTATTITTVTTIDQLKAAVSGDQPKIVVVSGDIDANTDAAGRPITCDEYAAGTGYTLAGYLAAYDPAVWGRTKVPSGPMETARATAQKKQAAQVGVTIGANTTLLGAPGATLSGAATVVSGNNVIVRGLDIVAPTDCFPAWDPTDTSVGNWNSEYDGLTISGATHVWVDHNEFSDGTVLDDQQPLYFGRPYQVHDGLLDIVRGADLVTVSWNNLHDHDKTMLIGNSDSRTSDRGKLRVTLHHNLWQNLGQRTPRVRYGQVDFYDNLIVQTPASTVEYGYSWGIGVESHLVAELNSLVLPDTIDPATVIHWWKGTAMTEDGNLLNGRPFGFLEAYNAANPTQPIGDDAGWTPTLRAQVNGPQSLRVIVPRFAGPQGLGKKSV